MSTHRRPRVPARAVLIPIALAIGAGACTGTASTSPTGEPTGAAAQTPTVVATPAASLGSPVPASERPSPVVTSAPTPAPSPTPVGGGAGDDDAIAHPTEPDAVVFRYGAVGGFVRPDFVAVQVPTFTLYGDGTVLYRSDNQEMPVRGEADPLRMAPVLVARMTEEQVQAFLADVLKSGLAVAAPEYRNDMVADAPTSVFTLNANGISKQVSIYALGIGDETAGDSGILQGIAALADRLGAFEVGVAAGIATDAGTFAPTSYVASLLEGSPGSTPPIDWPWPAFGPDSFADGGASGLGPLPSRLITAADAALVGIADIDGGASGISVTVDGVAYSLGLRPALPDEVR